MKYSPIYLDNAATTKVDDEVIKEILPYMSTYYGNPSSSHQFGKVIRNKIEESRQLLANLINAEKEEVIFTSGATESINAIFKSFIHIDNNKNKIIISATEHSAVIETCNYLESIGFEIIKLPVLSNGLINIDVLKKSIDDQTFLVSVMLVNNETGIIQPIKDISKIAKEFDSYVMTDATQAVGKIPIDVTDLNIDFLVFSGHKFHAPKGIGGFYINKRISNFTSLLHGGGQENKMRSSTLNVPGIIGIGKASEIALKDLEANKSHIKELQSLLESTLLSLKGVSIHGYEAPRIHTISNISFANIDVDILMNKLDDICLSIGSACNSELIEPSHVLKAMHSDDRIAFSSLRFSYSKFNTKEEIKYVVKKIKSLI